MKTNSPVLRMLKYKDFSGVFGYSAGDKCFFGRILGIADMVTFKGHNEDTLKLAFFDAVDDYLFRNNGSTMEMEPEDKTPA